jgi:hypothetical protein
MGPEIQDFVSLLGQHTREITLHFKPGMVGADRYAHGGWYL